MVVRILSPSLQIFVQSESCLQALSVSPGGEVHFAHGLFQEAHNPAIDEHLPSLLTILTRAMSNGM